MEISTVNLIGIITGVSGMITGIVGMLMGLRTVWISRYDITKGYFEDHNSVEMRQARKHIYNNKYKDEKKLLEDEAYATVCSHYHFYGLMRKKHYIPKYAFMGVNREAIIKCYKHSKKYIKIRRKVYKNYAEYFEWLYNDIK